MSGKTETRKQGDPRKAGGRFAGPGGAHDRSGIVIDATDAVLLDDVQVAMVEPYKDGRALLPAVSLKLAGRINRTQERAEIVYLMDVPASAALVVELMALSHRAGSSALLLELVENGMLQMQAEGLL